MSTADTALTGALVGFGRALRDRGLHVGPGQLVRYQAALAVLDATRLDNLYWAGVACLTSSRRDHIVYDEVFAAYFLSRPVHHDTASPQDAGTQRDDHMPDDGAGSQQAIELERPAADPQGDDGDDMSDGHIGAVTSPVEILRSKAFPECTPEELALLRRLLRNLRLSLPVRVTRRTRPGRSRRELDLRRTLRRSLRTHGEVIDRRWRQRQVRPRPTVLLLDVSGSMTGYSRALLQFAHSLSRSGSRVEVFCFGTRLTRVTNVLRDPDPDAALERAAARVTDWDGGTRIGASLNAFLRGWSRHGFVRGAVVVICSDGLERGDPDLLAAQMRRLARLASTIVWVNPLKGDPGYAPVVRGMRAALPSIDHLVAGDSLGSLERLADLLRTLR